MLSFFFSPQKVAVSTFARGSTPVAASIAGSGTLAIP